MGAGSPVLWVIGFLTHVTHDVDLPLYQAWLERLAGLLRRAMTDII